MGNNLRHLREEKHWTHERAAQETGVSRSQFIKLERNERRLNADFIARAAKAFGVKESEILTEKDVVPLVGYVGAGAEAHYYAEGQGPFEEVPMPENGTEATVAAEIRGDSIGPFFNTWLIYWDEVRDPPTEDLIGKLCVVETIEGKVLVKKLMLGNQPGKFHLLSQTESPIENAELRWAAKVTALTPR